MQMRRGLKRLRYKVVPTIYRALPADDDLYELFRLGARRYRNELSAGDRSASPRPGNTRQAPLVGRAGGVLAGGVVLFATGPVLHLQHSATTEQGRATCAIDPSWSEPSIFRVGAGTGSSISGHPASTRAEP